MTTLPNNQQKTAVNVMIHNSVEEDLQYHMYDDDWADKEVTSVSDDSRWINNQHWDDVPPLCSWKLDADALVDHLWVLLQYISTIAQPQVIIVSPGSCAGL